MLFGYQAADDVTTPAQAFIAAHMRESSCGKTIS